MLKAAGIITAGCLLMLLLNACDADQANVQPTQTPQSEPARTFVFSCDDGLEFVARLEDDAAWLFLPSGTLKLQKTSADNYRSKDITFQIKGQDSQLEESGIKHPNCRNDRRRAIWEHAKLNGADFRASGNEPGWTLEIIGQAKIVLITDYGSNRYEFDLTEPKIETAAKTTQYQVDQGGQQMTLTISGEACQDSMSGEKFESRVEVTFNGKTLRGCGRALH